MLRSGYKQLRAVMRMIAITVILILIFVTLRYT